MRGVYFGILFVAAFFNACASFGDIEELDSLYYKNENLAHSYEYAQKYAKDDFLWAFQSGILAWQAGDFAASGEHFDVSEAFFEENAESSFLSSGFKALGSILVNAKSFAYYGNLYEAVFANYYKALGAMMGGNYARARVEFNRANDRQRRAKDFYAKRIESVKSAVSDGNASYSNEAGSMNVTKTFDTLQQIYSQKYSNLAQFRAFEGYVNPMVSYISGLFFLTQNDYEKARDLLKESYGIAQNRGILEDLEALERRKNGESAQKYTWIIIEDGRSPKKYEFRVELPLFLVSSRVLHFGIALPNLGQGESANNRYFVKAREGAAFEAFEVANLEALVANEFHIELPYIIMTAVISSSYKVYLQHFLGEKFGLLGTLGAALFSSATMGADLRSARILPSRFLVARLENTAGKIRVFADRSAVFEFELDEKCANLCLDADNFVYLRIPRNAAVSALPHSVKIK